MDINGLEKKYKEWNKKFQEKYVLTEKNLNKTPLERFFMLHKMNATLFVATLIWILIANLFTSQGWLFATTIFVFFFTILISIIYSFKFVQPLLLEIDYEGYERHLFSRNIALQELLLTTAIAFLVGILPTYFAYFNIDELSPKYLFLNMLSVWLTCVAGGQKSMLKHARNVWIHNRNR